jgi:hypothetical protein
VKVAIAFSTKDKVALSKQTIKPLLKGSFDLFWSDGSDTEKGQQLPFKYGIPPAGFIHSNVRGGSDAAIAFNLTTLLQHRNYYDILGICENDVLLTDQNWFQKTMDLFDKGNDDGLEVGAVSPRCYVDRILIQRDNYALLHNVGAGVVLFTREAAELVLKHFRTGWTNANRLLFSQLSGLDIGAWWAFRGGQHSLCADWSFDLVLAAHGLASLALTPSPVEMVGQVPPLAEQGLTIAIEPVAERVNEVAFQLYRERLRQIRIRKWQPAWPGLFHTEPQHITIFPHQIPYLGGVYEGEWVLKWAQGFGPFVWKAGGEQMWERPDGRPTGGIFPWLQVPILGSCDLLISGGKDGGKIKIVDKQSGFSATPDIQPEGEQGQVFAINVPSACGYRLIEITALTPGIVFCGIRCREPQPIKLGLSFDHSWLPPVA